MGRGMGRCRHGPGGATGGVLLATVFAKAASFGWSDGLMIIPTFAAASSICATGSLALARRAQREELLMSGGDRPNIDHTP